MHRDPDHIKHEIDQIQGRMKARAENLGEHLSPNNLLNEGMGRAFSDPAGSFDKLSETIKRHPFASAMVAAGIASIAGAASRKQISNAVDTDELQHRAASTVAKGRETVARGRERAATMAKSSKDRFDTISEKVGETSRDLSARTRQMADDAAGSISKTADAAQQKSTDLARDAKHFAEENPVALGLFAVGVGALAASFFTARKPVSNGRDVGHDVDEAAPKVRQAKKATRAHSTPNKTVKRMSATDKTVKTKTASPAKKSSAKQTDTVEAKLNTSSKKQAATRRKTASAKTASATAASKLQGADQTTEKKLNTSRKS